MHRCRMEPGGGPRRPAGVQTIRGAQVIRLVLMLTVAGLVAACSMTAVPSPTPTSPLVTVELRGGECVNPTCDTTVILERDGRVHQAAKPPNDLGTVPPAALAALDAAIRTTDFAALKSRPFTGQCPTAFDGQETVYTFTTPGGVETIASCSVVVDPSLPVFAAVDAAIAAAARP